VRLTPAGEFNRSAGSKAICGVLSVGVGVYGEKLFGQVDHVPGLCYVSTLFWHAEHIPFLPLQSYIVLEGSEDGDAFQGKPIRLSLKSTIIGYLRGWLGTIAVFTAGVSGMATSAFFFGTRELGPLASGIASGGLFVWAVWFVLTTQSRMFLLVQGIFHGVTLLIWCAYSQFVEPNLAAFQAKLPELRCWPFLAIANGALLFYSLTRVWTGASESRAAELIAELNLPHDPLRTDGEPTWGAE
jgi:hypothetical protein